jgi:hypothetical protein
MVFSRGFLRVFERRGREGFAESAEKRRKRIQKKKIENFLNQYFLIFGFHFVFSLSSFAHSAKPSRPLRSKNVLKKPIKIT